MSLLQQLCHIFREAPMTCEERTEALLCKEALSEESVIQLDSASSVQLIREYGFPVREFHGTRYDN